MEYKDVCRNTEDFSRIISLKYDKKYWSEDSKENCPCSCSLAGRYLESAVTWVSDFFPWSLS